MGLIPGSGGFPWSREQQPASVFLPGKFHGQRSLAGSSHKESDMTDPVCVHTHTHTHTQIALITKAIELAEQRSLWLKSHSLCLNMKFRKHFL